MTNGEFIEPAEIIQHHECSPPNGFFWQMKAEFTNQVGARWKCNCGRTWIWLPHNTLQWPYKVASWQPSKK